MSFSPVIITILSLCLGLSTYASVPPLAEYTKQLGRVINELNYHEEWIESANEEIVLLERQIEESDKKIALVTREISDLESNIGQVETRIEVLKSERESYQTDISTLAKSVNWHLHSEYRLQKNHWLKSLLDYDQPKRRARFIRYHQFFVRSKYDSLEEFNSALTSLNHTNQQIHQERSRLKHQRSLAQTSKERLNEQSAQRSVQIANLQSEIHESEMIVEKLTLDQKRIRQLIIEIDALGLNVSAELSTDRKKISTPVDGTVVRKFGESRADGRLKWKGVVFAARDDSDVVAVAAGRVVMADWFQGYGLIVILDHGSDIKTIYANCNSLLVDVGDYAEAGETIATTGQSGGSTIPGLYFEVLEGGEQVDPIPWLQAQND